MKFSVPGILTETNTHLNQDGNSYEKPIDSLGNPLKLFGSYKLKIKKDIKVYDAYSEKTTLRKGTIIIGKFFPIGWDTGFCLTNGNSLEEKHFAIIELIP